MNNKYFNAIGFSDIPKHYMKDIINTVTNDSDEKYILGKNNTDIYVEFYKKYGSDFGVYLRGSLNEQEETAIDYYSPYRIALNDLDCDEISVEMQNGNYTVTAHDSQTGNEIFFLLQNVLDYFEICDTDRKFSKVNVVGMSISGKVLIPIVKNECCQTFKQDENENYKDLAKKARSGDKKALEIIENQELETIEAMLERLKKEDLLSVIESLFIPIKDNDCYYSVLGEIELLDKETNSKTHENIYRMVLDVTGTKLEICINENDLMGVPSVGMRFMGSCFFQGRIIA